MYCFPKVIKKVKDRRQKGKTKGENASLQFKKTKRLAKIVPKIYEKHNFKRETYRFRG